MTTFEKNRRILVIDDNVSIHEDFRKTLRATMPAAASVDLEAASLFGGDVDSRSAVVFDIDSAYQGQEGLELIKKAAQDRRPYALAFVDIRMPPGWDGIETIDRIWSEDPDIQVVICTAYSDYTWEDVVERLGVTDQLLILKKPFDAAEVLQLASALTMKWDFAQAAKFDPLTNIPNRRVFYDSLRCELERSRRYSIPLSCVMLDIDHFKNINDKYGHGLGDEALIRVAEVLTRNSRRVDIISRHGGDEFCAMLPETSEDDAVVWVEKIRTAVGTIKLSREGKAVQLTASCGVAEVHDSEVSPAELVERADLALRSAKTAGRDRVERYSSVLEADSAQQHPGSGLSKLLGSVVAGDIMTAATVSLRDDNTIRDASQLFLGLRVTSTPVLDVDGCLVGIVSEKDVMLSQNRDICWETPVRAVMKTRVITYEAHTPARLIYDFLCRSTIRRVVIVKEGKPIGMVSRGTVIRWFGNWGKAGRGPAHVLDRLDNVPVGLRITDRVQQTVRMLVDCSQQLEQHLAEGDKEDAMACIISEGSRIQDLATDLLAYAPLFGNELSAGCDTLPRVEGNGQLVPSLQTEGLSE